MQPTHIDMTSVEGVFLSFTFIFLAKIFLMLDVLAILQGISYLLAITAALDTMAGGPLKSYLTKKVKVFKKKK